MKSLFAIFFCLMICFSGCKKDSRVFIPVPPKKTYGQNDPLLHDSLPSDTIPPDSITQHTKAPFWHKIWTTGTATNTIYLDSANQNAISISYSRSTNGNETESGISIYPLSSNVSLTLGKLCGSSVLNLSFGELINDSLTWGNGNVSQYRCIAPPAAVCYGSGAWDNNSTWGYVGFKIVSSTATRYGWLRFSVPLRDSLRIQEQVLDYEPDELLLVGQVNR